MLLLVTLLPPPWDNLAVLLSGFLAFYLRGRWKHRDPYPRSTTIPTSEVGIVRAGGAPMIPTPSSIPPSIPASTISYALYPSSLTRSIRSTESWHDNRDPSSSSILEFSFSTNSSSFLSYDTYEGQDAYPPNEHTF